MYGVQPENSIYVPGQAVEVWSNSRQVWFVGTVEEISAPGNIAGVSPGCVKVRFGKKLEKWILPRDCFRVVRRHVPRETVSEKSAPPACVLRYIRERYYVADTSHSAAHPWASMVGGGSVSDGSEVLAVPRAADIWRTAMQEQGQPLSEDEDSRMVGLLRQAAFEIAGNQEVGADRLSIDSWVHYSLLKMYPPGRSVKEAIAAKLANASSRALSQMTSLWMKMDTHCTGQVSSTDLVEALQGAGLRKADAEEQAKAMAFDMDGDGNGRAQYCDFVVRYLKLPCSEVCLYWYDLSNNWAKYISPLVLWYQECGIWHTGVVVFGREYYYSGRIYKGRPGATPFGTPAKIQRLGLTFKNVKEVEGYFYHKLDDNFTEANYDILEHNCNHFSDQAALFLLGQQIPEEIRQQPVRALQAPMMRLVRPLLNQWLGRVEGDSTMAETDEAIHERLKGGKSALETIPRGSSKYSVDLMKDSVLMYHPPGNPKPSPAKVVQQHDDGSFDIVWYGPTGVGREVKGVPSSLLKREVPREDPGASCCMM